MITAYYQFKALPDAVKKANKIKSKNRLDCTKAFLPTGYSIEMLKTAKGQTCLYPAEPKEVVKANAKREGIINLTNGKNFSAVFIPDLECKEYGYGDFGSDALLFVVSSDLQHIEMLVFEGMRAYKQALYHKLVDGGFDAAIESMRERATPIYHYHQPEP